MINYGNSSPSLEDCIHRDNFRSQQLSGAITKLKHWISKSLYSDLVIHSNYATRSLALVRTILSAP